MNIFQKYKQFYLSQVWERRLEDLAPAHARLVSTLRILHLVIQDLATGQLNLYAMSLVYTTLLSMVPLIAVSFSVLKGFGVHNQVEPMLLDMLKPLGEKGVEITQHIMGFVDNIKVGVLGVLGLLLLIYTVIALLQKIERAFNYTWKVSKSRSFTRRFSDYLSVILVGPVLVFTALGFTASIASTEVVKSLMEIEGVGHAIRFGTRIFPYLLVIPAFAMVYIFITNTRVKLVSALVGASLAGILWQSAGWLFAAFVVNSTKYLAIYSAFATLIIFLIWLYASWLILLVGASVAYYFQHPENRSLEKDVYGLSNQMKEKLSLALMAVIGRRYYHQQQAWALEKLAQHLNVPLRVIRPLLDALVTQGLLLKTCDEVPAYVPAYAPEEMQVIDIVRATRQVGGGEMLEYRSEPRLDEICSRFESAMRDSLYGLSLRELADSTGQQHAMSSSAKTRKDFT